MIAFSNSYGFPAMTVKNGCLDEANSSMLSDVVESLHQKPILNKFCSSDASKTFDH